MPPLIEPATDVTQVSTSYFRNAHGVLLVYDVTSQRSADGIGRWLEQVDSWSGDNVIRILVGNKCEMPHDVDTDSMRRCAEERSMLFFETSAKACVGRRCLRILHGCAAH